MKGDFCYCDDCFQLLAVALQTTNPSLFYAFSADRRFVHQSAMIRVGKFSSGKGKSEIMRFIRFDKIGELPLQFIQRAIWIYFGVTHPSPPGL